MMRRPRSLSVDDRGVGLVEVLVAVVLFGIIASSVLALVIRAQEATVNNRARVAASNLAARELDYVRQEFLASDAAPATIAAAGVVTNPHPLAGATAGASLVVDGTPYTVTRTATWNVVGDGGSACEGGALVKYPTMNVTVTVTWPRMGSTRPVASTTTLAPPKGTELVATKGYVAVKVVDASGKPNPGRTVTVSSTSETRRGTTDGSGCALVEVNPAAGTTGTSYSARIADPGYVDPDGNSAAVKLVGYVKRGQLNSSLSMSYDKAGSLRITVTGGDVTDADLVTSKVSVYKSVSSGSSPIKEHPLTGVTTTIKGLWPGDYSAFFGTVVPPTITLVSIPSGGLEELVLPMIVAETDIAGVPAGATVYAVSGGVPSCDPPAKVVDPAHVSVLAGTWSFAAGRDGFGCSPGPAAQQLVDGVNPTVEWAPSTLTITGAPVTAGPLWAVSSAAAAASCTVPSPATHAVLLGSGPVASAALPAGDWYVFATAQEGAAPQPGRPCLSTGLVGVPYGTDQVFAWIGPGDQP